MTLTASAFAGNVDIFFRNADFQKLENIRAPKVEENFSVAFNQKFAVIFGKSGFAFVENFAADFVATRTD